VGRLGALSGRELVHLLREHGFRFVSQRGSHVKLRKGDITLIVPCHGNKPLRRSLLPGILKDADLDPGDFA
jgi:predicted RNA binding protein YcfA (HicA-like mRNA interferase family)